MVISNLAFGIASQSAITVYCYLNVAGIIAVAVYQTGDAACAVTAAGNRCITVGAYYIVQAYAQLCFAYIRISLAIHYQIVVLIQACICSACTACPLIVTCIVRYLAAAYAINCAITINCYLKVTGIIVIAVYQTGDVACAVTATGNRCIAIGAVHVTQANIQRCLAYNRLAIFFQFQLIVILQCCIVCC